MPLYCAARPNSALSGRPYPAMRPVAAALAALFVWAGAPAQAENKGGMPSFEGGRGGAGSYASFGMGENGLGGSAGPATGGHWGMEMRGPGAVTGPALNGGYGLDGSRGEVDLHGAGGGGGGGSALRIINTSGGDNVNSRISITGGRGGNGGDSAAADSVGRIGAGSGGGGGGGDAIELFSNQSFRFVNDGIVMGGEGGNGGLSSVTNGLAGGGGAGGNGITTLSATGVVIENRSAITGGNGGNSMSGSPTAAGSVAGAGGAGVVLGSGTLNNTSSASIRGGNSGFSGGMVGLSMNNHGGAGVSMTGGVLTNAGFISGGNGLAGGAGVEMTGAGTIVNAGAIQGGMIGGGTRADSVLMSGDGGRLELRDGYSFLGRVNSTGIGNVLALGGDVDSSFNLTHWGNGYLGFSSTMEKTGNSTWLLTGQATQAPNWTVKSGTLSFTSGAQLGGSSSTIALGNATLAYAAVGGQATLNAAVSMTGAVGTIGVASGGVLVVSQAVSGSTLKKDGPGTLSLKGPAQYGTLLASDGLVILDNPVLPQRIGSNAVVSIYTRGDQTHTGDILGLDLRRGVMIKDGLGTLTLAGANVLDWRIVVGGLTASPDRFQGDVDMLLGSRFTLDGATDGSYAGKLSGAGTFTKRGAGRLDLLGDSSAFTGPTQVEQGTLNLAAAASLGGGVVVNGGATLGGSGTVGSMHVLPGGTLSLADGDFKVKGDAVFRQGSTFAVRADPNGTPGRLVADGQVDLQGGNVLHVGVGDGFAIGSTYPIVSANRVQGRFDGVSSQYAYLTAALDYSDAKAVNLRLVRRDILPPIVVPPDVTPPILTPPAPRPIRFDDLATTANQRAVGLALESLPGDNPIYRAVLGLPVGAPPQALAALSGESHASTASALAGLGANARMIPLAQLRRGLGATMTPGSPTASAGASDAPLSVAALPGSDALPAWAQVVGQWQRSGGEDGIARTRQHTGGVYAGADRAIGNGWRLGGAVGVTNSKLKVDDLNSQSDIDSYSATVYGGRRYDAGPGHINLLLGAAYTWHDISSKRNVGFAGVNQELKADYGASTGQLFGEIGYGLPVSDRAVLEPYAGVAFNDQRVRGFSESGGAAALSGDRQHDQTTTTTLGLRGTMQWDSLAFTAGAGWRHAFGDVNPASTLAFAGSDAFTVAGAPIARNALAAELAGQWRVSRGMALTLAYDGEYGGGNQQHAGTLRVNWRF